MSEHHVVLDRDRCSGFGLCAAYAPEVFALDHAGIAELAGGALVPARLLDAARAAERACPQRVITLQSLPPEAAVQH